MLFLTHSESSFILEDLVLELNVKTHPVLLKLSTMTAVDTIITSKTTDGFSSSGTLRHTFKYSEEVRNISEECINNRMVDFRIGKVKF